jgi:hypothetical protein
MLKPFQKSPLAEWEDSDSAITAVRREIQARTDVIYQQLLRWPQVPSESQQ